MLHKYTEYINGMQVFNNTEFKDSWPQNLP